MGEHLAILNRRWKLADKIKSGDKTIESRWYMNKYAPWNKIMPNDTVYFKESGYKVSLKAKVHQVQQFSDLTPSQVHSILREHSKDIGIEKKDIPTYYNLFKSKRYCILVFLTDVTHIKPFDIDKTGFGVMSAWISSKSIKQLKKT